MCSSLEKQHIKKYFIIMVIILCFVMGYVLQSGETAHKKVRYYYGYYSGGDSVALDMSQPLLPLPGMSVGDNSALKETS